MSSTDNSNWISNYYNRIQSDCVTSFARRDRVTNWSYTILAVVIAAYAGFFADGTFVTPLGRFGLVAGALFVLIRFFFTSMIAYIYFLRGRYFRTRIEQYWMDGKPTLDEIKKDIKTYDHGKSQPPLSRSPFRGQVKSGFFLILIIPLIPLGIEFYLGIRVEYFVILGALIIYILFEKHNFKNYDQVQPPKENS